MGERIGGGGGATTAAILVANQHRQRFLLRLRSTATRGRESGGTYRKHVLVLEEIGGLEAVSLGESQPPTRGEVVGDIFLEQSAPALHGTAGRRRAGSTQRYRVRVEKGGGTICLKARAELLTRFTAPGASLLSNLHCSGQCLLAAAAQEKGANALAKEGAILERHLQRDGFVSRLRLVHECTEPRANVFLEFWVILLGLLLGESRIQAAEHGAIVSRRHDFLAPAPDNRKCSSAFLSPRRSLLSAL